MHLVTLFQQLTNFTRNRSNTSTWPDSWRHIKTKRYDRFPQIRLTDDLLPLDTTLKDTLEARHSDHAPKANNLSRQELSTLLYYSVGIKGGVRRFSVDTSDEDFTKSRRFYPSGGARYPTEVYVAVRKHPELAPALYHYNVVDHALEQLFGETDITETMTDLARGNPWLQDVDVCILTSAVLSRSSLKYDTFAYNLALTEAGHVGQNVLLTATALGLNTRPLSITRSTIHERYDLDRDEVFIYNLPLFR